MSDFVGRLLREPGPRLRPLLPNVFDAAAPRLQTDGDPVPAAFVEQQPPALAAQRPRASTSAPGRAPDSRHEPEPATEAQQGQDPETRTGPGAEQGRRASTAAGTTPDRPLPRAVSRTTDVTEALPVPGMHTDRPRSEIAPPHAPTRQSGAGLPLAGTPVPEAGLPRHLPLAPAAATEPDSDTPPKTSTTPASGIRTRPTTAPAPDTPTRTTATPRPAATPGETTTPRAADTGDHRVRTEPENRSSPTPEQTSEGGPQGAHSAQFVVRSEVRVARAQEVTAAAQSDRPPPEAERVPPVATDAPEAGLPVPSGSALAPAARPGAPGDLVRTSHPVRPVVASLATTAPPGKGRAPGAPEAAEPVVRITIDRLEIRAAPPPAVAPRSSRRRPRLSLDEYLRGRS
jgi:hypothetical protein